MTDLRETIWLLDKEIIEFSIFMDHLTGYLNRQKKYLNGLEVKLDSSVDKKCVLEPGQSMNLTRIIQEALNNTRKYAEAKEITISFMLQEKMLSLDIADNGKGMNVDEAMDKGNGLSNMTHRAKEMNAVFHINSEHDLGTTINLKFEVKIP